MPAGKRIDKDRDLGRKPSGGALLRGTTILQCLVVILLVVDILLLYGILLSPQGVLRYHEQSGQVEELENKILKLREDNHRLFRRIQGFKSDPLAQERLVREQLGWVRENELMIEFVKPSKDGP